MEDFPDLYLSAAQQVPPPAQRARLQPALARAAELRPY
jgi:hypothetical protein